MRAMASRTTASQVVSPAAIMRAIAVASSSLSGVDALAAVWADAIAKALSPSFFLVRASGR
jgi:hypothetical protein